MFLKNKSSKLRILRTSITFQKKIESPNFCALLNSFLDGNTEPVESYAGKTATLRFPLLTPDTIKIICSEITKIWKEEPVSLDLKSPVVVVGDLHGQILDLLRILNNHGQPSKQKYLFLGDLVDRGEFSIEVVLIVFLMKIIYPDNVSIIRGNHEFNFLCSKSGFSDQLADAYSDPSLFEAFLESFSYMPITALIDEQVLCVHGGIGPQVYSIKQFKEIQRPIQDFGDPLIDALLWSDPTTSIDYFEMSSRGTGYLFGQMATDDFIDSNKITMIVRAHECVGTGVEITHKGRCVTVFSASNYCGLVGNQGGVLVFHSRNQYDVQVYPPLPWIRRGDVVYKNRPKANRPVLRRVITASESTKAMPRFRISEPPKASRILGSSPRQMPSSPRRFTRDTRPASLGYC